MTGHFHLIPTSQGLQRPVSDSKVLPDAISEQKLSGADVKIFFSLPTCAEIN